MSLWADPRFSNKSRVTPEQRVDEAYERSGIGPGLIVILIAALGLVILAPTLGFDNPDPLVVDYNSAHSTVR